MGSAFSVTEFVPVSSLFLGTPASVRMFRYTPEERPVIFQVFGPDAPIMQSAIRRILPLGPDGIEINAGCSVRKVVHKGSGAGLLRNPDTLIRMVQLIREVTDIPVSVKYRLGWDSDSINYLDIGRRLEDAGVARLSLHARTRAMGYSGSADWEAIADLKRAVAVPVWGNGDVTSYREAMQRMDETCVDGVLVGRAAIGNPWIFSGSDVREIPYSARLPVILEHFRSHVEFYGRNVGVISFRKNLSAYLRDLLPPEQLTPLLRLTEPDQVQERLIHLRLAGDYAFCSRSALSMASVIPAVSSTCDV